MKIFLSSSSYFLFVIITAIGNVQSQYSLANWSPNTIKNNYNDFPVVITKLSARIGNISFGQTFRKTECQVSGIYQFIIQEMQNRINGLSQKLTYLNSKLLEKIKDGTIRTNQRHIVNVHRVNNLTTKSTTTPSETTTHISTTAADANSNYFQKFCNKINDPIKIKYHDTPMTITKDKNVLYARFGKDKQQKNWKYLNGIENNINITILTEHDLSVIRFLIKRLYDKNDVKQLSPILNVKSDINLALQNRQSRNPSTIIVRSLDSFDSLGKDVTLCLDLSVNSDLTRISLTRDKKRIKCFGSPRGNNCGKCNLPDVNRESTEFLLHKIYLQPAGKGSQFPDNQIRRNQYILKGSYYYVYVKVATC